MPWWVKLGLAANISRPLGLLSLQSQASVQAGSTDSSTMRPESPPTWTSTGVVESSEGNESQQPTRPSESIGTPGYLGLLDARISFAEGDLERAGSLLRAALGTLKRLESVPLCLRGSLLSAPLLQPQLA